MEKDKPQGAACRPPIIGIDASRANRAQRTGVERYAFQVIQQLKSVVPPNVRVVLYSPEPLLAGLAEMPPNWESRILRWPPARLWTQVRLSYEMMVRPPDLLFVPAHVLPLVLPPAAVITVHDVGFMEFPQAYKPLDRHWQRWSTARAARKAQAVITVSDFSKDEIVRWFPAAAGKITVTRLDYDRERFRPVDKSELIPVLDKYSLRQPYFLFVGRLEEKKSLRTLLRAFRQFHEAEASGNGVHQLALAGPRGFGFESAWQEVADASAEQAVKPLGYVADQDMAALYSGAEALVFPSAYEGFGFPLLEAMACGTPVIAGQAASLPEIAGPEAAIYVPPDRPEALAKAMAEIINDEHKRERLVSAGCDRLKDFSWQRTAEQTWEALRQALPQTPCP